MSFDWPWALLAVLVVPLIFLARWWFNRRRKRTAITVSSVALIRAALPGRSSWRRRVPVALFLAGLVALAGALARPQATVAVPSNDTSILLAIDVSSSMCSTDVQPNRITAASKAAHDFVENADDDTRIGLVTFSGISGLMVPPTTDKDKLLEAIDTLKTARGTAIGQAILSSIDAIAESNPQVARTGVDLGEPDPNQNQAAFQPDTIVVLTDGSNTTGVDPVTAAEQAAARRLRVFTIGFGTTEPSPMVCTADQIGPGAQFGRPGGGAFGGGFRGGRRALEIDEDALTKVADLTGGRYFRAQDAGQLTDVLGDLPQEIGLHRKETEISVFFILAAVLLVFTGIGLSLWWNRAPARRSRPPSPGQAALP
ncbi:VWA domain-containing protein [Actinoplanes sp. NBRC 103695]|uniref:VWA domain-containing protein n=1 Tax=Actinoplanes sp. NBRC 103695 TaxID=3032202 RepID=UPI0024A48490|nr:VWA domain-containing protein [Actinoplanes sp. NBRC 103695]GLY94489.1 aerotolerance regulator BatA [Actinoplanes sp. NBRC 103695]